jgi:hypothetical protein
MQTADQSLAIEGLGKKTHCSRRQRFRAAVFLGKGGDEDDRHAFALGNQVPLEINPAHARHSHIGNQTGRVADARRPQELFGGCKCIGGETMQTKELGRRESNGFVIVNN